MLSRDEKTSKSFGAAGKVVLVEQVELVDIFSLVRKSSVWWNRCVPREKRLMKMMVAFTIADAWSLWTETFSDQLATWWIDVQSFRCKYGRKPRLHCQAVAHLVGVVKCIAYIFGNSQMSSSPGTIISLFITFIFQ